MPQIDINAAIGCRANRVFDRHGHPAEPWPCARLGLRKIKSVSAGTARPAAIASLIHDF